MSGLNSWRYTSSSGSFRLPRSWIMFRIVSAVRISRTFSSYTWGNLPPFAVGLLFLLCAHVDAYLFTSADYYCGSVAIGLSPLRRSRTLGNYTRSSVILGVPFVPLRGFITPRPLFGRCVFPAMGRKREPSACFAKRASSLGALAMGLRWCRLGTGLQAIKLSPHHAGL